jgi:oligoribonuclease (3'-5' exoribonuclease)
MKRGQPRVDLVVTQCVLLRGSPSSTCSRTSEHARAVAVTFDEAETVVLDYIKTHVSDARSAAPVRQLVATVRGFLARDMPRSTLG